MKMGGMVLKNVMSIMREQLNENIERSKKSAMVTMKQNLDNMEDELKKNDQHIDELHKDLEERNQAYEKRKQITEEQRKIVEGELKLLRELEEMEENYKEAVDIVEDEIESVKRDSKKIWNRYNRTHDDLEKRERELAAEQDEARVDINERMRNTIGYTRPSKGDVAASIHYSLHMLASELDRNPYIKESITRKGDFYIFEFGINDETYRLYVKCDTDKTEVGLSQRQSYTNQFKEIAKGTNQFLGTQPVPTAEQIDKIATIGLMELKQLRAQYK